MKKKDLEQIAELFSNLFNTSFAQIWEHNLEPAFSGLFNKVDALEKRVGRLESKVEILPTKEYIDEKLGALRADFNLKIRKP
jgi:hypothetical protein